MSSDQITAIIGFAQLSRVEEGLKLDPISIPSGSCPTCLAEDRKYAFFSWDKLTP